jgi:amino acid adenylation domain-containing protein
VALVFEEQQLTYGQLNRRANQLTHHLQMLGVGPEVLVGICMDRSIEMVMAMLGVLKAGGAYVPLDPTYPQERLAFLVTDSGVQVVLIHSLLKPEWLLSHKLQILDLGRQWEAMSAHRQENWQGSVVSENVAYVIYTSGSTGKPKGTMVRHRNVVNFLTGMDERLGSQVSGSWLAVTSICFDISVLELLWTLTRGLQVVIHAQESERLPSPGKMASQETMLQEIQRQGITHLQCTPSQASLLFAEPDQLSALASLRTLLLGGEALPMALVKQLETVLVGDLYNMYGPTETTIWSTMQRVEKGATTVSIGRPIVNTRVYILDQHWQVVPIGGAGELFLGGKGVVRGYWNHPELTAESFLPDPWSQEAGAVMYRTGDRARYLPDGSIEFLGRMDQQVKLRGYRIELGEIEAVLCSHPGVREGVVQVREDVPGDKRLVAYVVGSQDLTEARLRSFLQEQLPAYMLPSQFLLLDAMPLTPNGKLDRLALPAPQQWHGQAQEGQQGARTGIEELLVDLWSQVLGHSQVGIHDSFFELGGHSLLATQLIARVREMLEVEISLRAVFEAPTVARFALHVEQELRKSKGLLIPPLVAKTRSKEIPLSFAQQRLWFLDQLESGSTAYLLPNVLHFLGSLNTRAFERSLEELLHRHEILRTTFVAHADQPVQVIHPAKRYCLPVIDLQGVREHEKTRLVEQLAEQEVRRPCDLAEGPLLRVYMFRLQLQDHRVFITLHHIITDGWSNGVLVRELSTLYQAFIMEQCSPLEPLPLQYADYTLWQQQWLQGEILTSLLNYWTKQLRGASPLKLPTDRPRTARVSNHGAIHTFKLPSSLYQSLVALSHQENVTLFMTLLAAFQVLLHRYTGMQDVVVGTDVANRTSTETEKIIGFFVNLLVLRVQLSDQETFRELLKSVRTTVLNAYAHQDLPFEKLIDSLQLGRDGKQMPLVNVLFVLQNMTQQAFELPGLTVSSIGTQAHTAKFDIAMFLTEEAQELIGYVNYRTDLFQPDSIAHLVHHFKVLLQSIVTSPDVIIGMLEMVTEEEKQQKSFLESTSHEKRIKKLKSAKRIKLRLSPED